VVPTPWQTGGPITVANDKFASWYPNAVSLTEVILTQRQQISTAGALTRDIAADGMARLQEIIPGLSPSLDFARNSV
jgi:hypothetical protein